MSLARATAVIATALYSTVAFAANDKVPSFDAEPSCRAVQGMGFAGRTVEICMRSENEARDTLSRNWTQYPLPDRDRCVGLGAKGNVPSYVDILTCLEIARDVANLKSNDLGLTGVTGSTRKRGR